MIDLSTKYLGLTLKNPLVCSSSPLCESLEELAGMEAAGASAVVLHSLFEEQIQIESNDLSMCLDYVSEGHPEAIDYFPNMADYNLGSDGYLEHLREAKALLKIPVIASLNGTTRGGWTRFAREMQDAGANALELNIYFLPTDASVDSVQVERQYLDLVTEIRATVQIPLAVKLSPFFSAPAAFGKRLADAGVDGLVLFNRFYQADIDLNTLRVMPTLTLSTPHELLLRLHWIAILFGQVKADLAATGGVHSSLDVLKVMMVGGKVAMMTSALLKHGVKHLRGVLEELVQWMTDHGYHSIQQMQGSMSMKRVENPESYERANYMKVLREYSLRMS
jgi:dihydroorotate dehydrogenase (fumarate)